MAAVFHMMRIAFLCAPLLATAAASQPTMRRETTSGGSSFSQVSMSSSGRFAATKIHLNVATSDEVEAELRARLVKNAEAEAEEERRAAALKKAAGDRFVDNDLDTTWDSQGTQDDYCNDDFPLGKDKTNECFHDTHQPLVSGQLAEDMADCRQAATQAGINITIDFEVPYDYYRKHPMGCFVVDCSEPKFTRVSPQGKCYFYNASPSNPDQIESGTPVCKRPRIMNGTVNTNGGCPDHYQPIMNEAKCAEFADCLGRCVGSNFRINLKNASIYNEYPKYCFIRHQEYDNCVYWNEPREGMEDPKDPVGMPLCNVSQIVHYPEGTIGGLDEVS